MTGRVTSQTRECGVFINKLENRQSRPLSVAETPLYIGINYAPLQKDCRTQEKRDARVDEASPSDSSAFE